MPKCSECGFLAARNIASRELDEVERDWRKEGVQPYGDRKFIHVYPLICFKLKINLGLPKQGLNDPVISQSDLIIELQKERDCESFTQWHQGFTPKEHQEMIDRKEMLEWQAQREDADRKWREVQESKHSKEEWHRYLFVGILGFVAVIVGVLLGHFWN